MEEAGRTIRDHARVLKINLQYRLGCEVEADEPIMPWLLRWAAIVAVQVQAGCRWEHPYERQRGRKCNVQAVPFGGTVLFRMPEVAIYSHQLLEERWSKGVWLGHTRNTSEVLIGTDEGIVE